MHSSTDSIKPNMCSWCVSTGWHSNTFQYLEVMPIIFFVLILPYLFISNHTHFSLDLNCVSQWEVSETCPTSLPSPISDSRKWKTLDCWPWVLFSAFLSQILCSKSTCKSDPVEVACVFSQWWCILFIDGLRNTHNNNLDTYCKASGRNKVPIGQVNTSSVFPCVLPHRWHT